MAPHRADSRPPAHSRLRTPLLAFGAALLLSACGGDPAPVSEGYGEDPLLPEPENKLIPTVKVADAERWPEGTSPEPAAGLSVTEFAADLDHPRRLFVLPNGDVLVAETNGPPREEHRTGIRGFFMGLAMKEAGAAVESANRITLLRDADGDGIAEFRSYFLEDLNSPYGMALAGDQLYIANTDGVVSVPYTEGDVEAQAAPKQVTSLPAGEYNHHWTKNIVANSAGTKLYAAVGSNSNVGENGMDKEEGRAAIWEIDLASGEKRLFATGLRNPVGMDFDANGQLYVAVNERDEIGDNLVPDYLTSVQDGGFYGWPYSYFGDHVDERVEPQRPELVAEAIVPDYALGAHTASLGLAIADGEDNALGGRFGDGAYVGQHGSWNRKPRSGYKVVFVPFGEDGPSGDYVDILTGFLAGDKARGRPVGVEIDKTGGLLVADDVGNRVWRVTARENSAAAQR